MKRVHKKRTAGKTCAPRDLALVVHSELMRRTQVPPSQGVLIRLFESLYFTSLQTEESEPIRIHVVYLNPQDPDPEPPPTIVKDRWSYVRLGRRIRMTIPNIVKIARASDPRSSSFAVFPDRRGRLWIWGLIDQGNRYYDYVNYESDEGPERPGLFEASIGGIGHVVAYIKYEKIAELRINSIIRDTADVLWGGPVRKGLQPGIEAYYRRVHSALPKELRKELPEWAQYLASEWVSTLCRLLLRIQNYHNGGALLITPDSSFSGLRVKYGLKYDRLRIALEHQAVFEITKGHASNRIFGDYIERQADEIPVELYFDETVSDGDLEDSQSELEGAIWFVSLLSRVDGLVLLNNRLEVQGFGVEITHQDEPRRIYLARDRQAKKEQRRKLNYERFGTRHRSMMRYCAKVPKSVGFVISQDGDIRVMTQVQSRLVMWENIRLQLLDFIRHKKSRKTVASS